VRCFCFVFFVDDFVALSLLSHCHAIKMNLKKQDEIERLKAALAMEGGAIDGGDGGGDGGAFTIGPGGKMMVNRVVEKVVAKGVTKEQVSEVFNCFCLICFSDIRISFLNAFLHTALTDIQTRTHAHSRFTFVFLFTRSHSSSKLMSTPSRSFAHWKKSYTFKQRQNSYTFTIHIRLFV
jgi:hypothetical protein